MSTYKSNIWKMYLFAFFGWFCFVCGVIIPFFTDWGGLNLTQVMILQSWFVFWIFILEIPTGAIADRFGRKTSLILGSVIMIITPIIYASIPNFFIFMIGEFLWALASSLFSGAYEALIYDTLRKIRKTYQSKMVFARSRSFELMGLAISSLIGGFIALKFGLRLTMMSLSIPFLLVLFIAFTLKEPKIEKEKRKEYISIIKGGIKELKRNKVLQILVFDFVSIATIVYLLRILYQAFMQHLMIKISYFGIAMAGIVIIQLILINSYRWFEKILKSKRKFIFYLSFFTGLFTLLALACGFYRLDFLAVAFIILAIGFGYSRTPLMISYINKYISSKVRATTLSTISMINTAVLVVVNPLIGRLADWSLNYTLLFLGMVAIFFSLISRVEEEHLID